MKKSAEIPVISVSLVGTVVDDAALEQLKELTQLQRLDLSDTHVTDAGLEHLKGFTQLQSLNLNETAVSKEGVKKLQQALPKCKISPHSR